MKRLLFAVVVALFPGTALAAACPPVPFVFSNGSPFDAKKANDNWAAVRNCANSIVVTPSDSVTWVSNTVALKALPPPNALVYRAGFYAPGDGGQGFYNRSPIACTLNGGNGDDGSQMRAEGGGCWVRAEENFVDLRVWGATSDQPAFDSGPAVRAASLYSELSGATISVPAGVFYINTVDPEDTGAIVFGKVDKNVPAPGYPLPTFKVMPSFAGATWHNDPNMCLLTEPTFFLGPGVNRPLIFIKSNSESARLENLCLHGNRAAQTGYPAGPGGKLFAVVAEATANIQPSSSFSARSVAIRDGYNGNLFYGSGRGLLYLTDVWSLYSGQAITDWGLYLDSYDAIITNLQQGLSTGYGVYIANGINYTFTAGGSFYNDTGMYVSGAVVDLQVQGMRLQANQKQGLVIGSEPAVAGQQIGGRSYTGLAFNNNSASGDNLYDDIAMLGNSIFHDTFTAPAFDGPQNPADPKPRYNIGTQSFVRVTVNGAMNSTASNTSGFANDFTSVVGDYQYTPTWVPRFLGTTSGGAGTDTPAAGFPIGKWSRFGKQATLTGAMNITAFAAVGDMLLGPSPQESQTGSLSACSLVRVVGWTPPVGYTNLTLQFGGNSTFATFIKEGPGVAPLAADAGEFAAPIEFTFSCSYPIKDGV